jgi:ADP-heptose:LPS heptosyltransferase
LNKVAVVKPDHLGDLILSVPAIRAAQNHFGAISLFVSDSTRPLAHFLFPELELRSINFPHLTRNKSIPFDLDTTACALNEFDLVLWLRDDPFIGAFAERVKVRQDFASGGYFTHESAIQKRMMLRHVENYSRTKLFSTVPIHWPGVIRKIGLCIGSAFPTNRWPNVVWLQLASTFLQSGLDLILIAGPGETKDVALLSRSLKGGFTRIVIGGTDFGAFLDEIADVDLIIATDGGSAHICSLHKPVLSIFGSSPWRRYAPFGCENVVLTRDLACSPCCNFSMEEVNGCMTRECIVGLEPELVPLIVFGGRMPTNRRFVIQRGASHVYEE